jgi:hypothetical protein
MGAVVMPDWRICRVTGPALRLQHCDRLLEGIARQRANDLEAERLLHREAALLRVRIGALPDRR